MGQRQSKQDQPANVSFLYIVYQLVLSYEEDMTN